MKKTILETLGCLAFGALVGAILGLAAVGPEVPDPMYCEMVKLRIDSGNPTIGWPDYAGCYEELCNDPSAKK